VTSYLQPSASAIGHEQSCSFDDQATGYHAHGQQGDVVYHRASLPRLLHGDNGNLIKNQTELDAALDRLKQKAGELGTSCTPDSHFTRVDLVWQFRGDPAQYVQAHRNCRHARIRSDVIRYEQRSLALKGSELRISIYDKTLERFKRHGNIVRVEAQLRGRLLKEQLGDGDPVQTLDFDKCYQAFRRIMLGFIPPGIPQASGIAQLLAIGEREQWESGGVAAFDLYTKGMSERHIRRLKSDMALVRPAVFQIDWSQLLPANGPPAPVELDNEKASLNRE